MKRFILLATVFICYTFALLAQNRVFICTGKSSAKYHATKNCKGLRSCNAGIASLSIQEAKAKGRTACRICITAQDADKANGTNARPFTVSPGKGIELATSKKRNNNQIIRHIGYTTCFNTQRQIPDWVAYDLTQKEVQGTEPRPNREFEPDPDAVGATAVHRDYTNSGYSRGHMAPAADMKWSEQAMRESFYLSNVCPQKSELNDGVWKRLEERVRALAGDNTVYVCCGPIVGRNPKTIGNHCVTVPEGFFKVLCMKRKGKWQAVGFVFTNSACKGSMFDYATTVDAVEELTGLDFFYNLTDSIENAVEATWKMQDWQ